MKIVVFAWRDVKHPKAGGSERFLHESARRWVEQGHYVVFITARSGAGKKLAKRENVDGIEFLRAGGRATVYMAAPLVYWLGAGRGADAIVDVENGIPFFTPLYARKPILCIVNHVHKEILLSELKFPLNRFAHFMETRLFPFVYRRKKIAAISTTTERDLIDLGFRPDNLKVVYCGVDHDTLKPSGRKASLPTVCYVGRIQPYKRVDALIRAFEKVKRTIPTARLVIGGTGDASAKIAAIAESSSDSASIDFLGEITESKKAAILAESWVYATASSVEGWGLVVIEANACGTPAVGCRVPGLLESIVDGRTGLLADGPEHLAEKIEIILADKELRMELGKAAVEFAAGFDWQDTADAYLSMLREMK